MEDNSFLDYLKRERNRYVMRYRAAQYWVTRADARRQVLHLGRLIRMYGG